VEQKKPVTNQSFVIYAAFFLGLLTAIAIRALIVLDHVEPSLVRPVWYFAVLGNFLFFFYRFRITQKRRKAIDDYQLIHKIESDTCLSEDDKNVLLYLLASVKKSLENMNYLIIFIFSILAIVLDIILSVS
jgi:hypothetical protein